MTDERIKAMLKEVFKPLIQEVIKEEMTSPLAAIKNPEQKLTVKAAAKEFGYATEYELRRAMNGGELAYYLLGKFQRPHLRRADVAAYTESKRVRTNDEVQDYSFLRTKRK